jgi:release factor glutamine methyltransferase
MSSRPAPSRPPAPPYPAPGDGLADASDPARHAGADTVETPAASWAELLAQTEAALGERREARWLVEQVAAASWAVLRSRAAEPAPEPAARLLARLVERRRAGEPLQHVLGHWPFRSLDLLVDGRALVPRPETEVVVDVALAELAGRASERARPAAADLGTGGGAIALALVAEHPDLDVVALDRSADALALAAANRARLDPSAAARLRLVRSDWYGAVTAPPGGFDLVVANPPYLADAELAGLDAVVREHEPHAALLAGPSGLEAVGAVVRGAPAVLAAGGSLVVEIAPHQAATVRELAEACGAARARVEEDLAGRPRVLVARW